jgi:GMP synthase (glutamine-hydrolysing)
MNHKYDTIAVLDFGSQFTQLIARRIRELGVYAEILPCDSDIEKVKALNAVGVILSGGPASIHEEDAPYANPELLNLNLPTFGICYGMHWIVHTLGGEVLAANESGEYGRREIDIVDASDSPLNGISGSTLTWMSHRDQINSLPDGLKIVAKSETCPVAAMADHSKGLYGVQFHPEVRHTEEGTKILKNFLFDICNAETGWSMDAFEKDEIEKIRKQVGTGTVIGGVSGGVDSSVMATLMAKAIGEKFVAIFVDNGLLRKNEREQVVEMLAKHGVNLKVIDARERFLNGLAGVTDPEVKRKRIGHTFIEVFDEESSKYSDAGFLAQGTLYPDVIESISSKGPSATIKSHHNVGGLPDDMKMDLVEPLRELFKDEVRELGRKMGLSEEVIERHPFPGPGLAVRILGEITAARLETVREADAIFMEELRAAGWYLKVSQALAVLLPVKTVGVMGDSRTYDEVIALRSVDTWDFMTADFSPLPHDLLGRVSTRIINEVRGVNRVVYDISSKPPATVEWE